MSLEAISIIDLDTSQPFMSVVHGKQYDTVRMVEAHLYFSGVKWYVPEDNIYALVSYRKSDNIGGFYDITESGQIAVSVKADDRSVIFIALDAQILRTPGEVKVETVFYDTITAGRLSSFSFIVDVEEASVREVDLASNPYFNALAEQIRAVLEAEAKLTGLEAVAETLAPGDEATVTVEGGTSAEDPYVFHLGIPSMPGMTISASKLAPDATPTATISGGTQPGEAFAIALGIPSMPGMIVSKSKLAPDAEPTVQITGGQQPGQAYNIAFGIPSMPGITVSVSKLAPGVNPTVQITGGTQPGEDYNIAFGIPCMPGITVSASRVAAGANPTVQITGGQQPGQAYNIAFGIPDATQPTPISFEYAYALSISGTTPPDSGWRETPSFSLDERKGKLLWSRTITNWSNGNTSTEYLVAYNGADASGAVVSVNGRDGMVNLTLADVFEYAGRI